MKRNHAAALPVWLRFRFCRRIEATAEVYPQCRKIVLQHGSLDEVVAFLENSMSRFLQVNSIEVCSLTGIFSEATGIPVDKTDIQSDVQAEWQYHKAHPDRALNFPSSLAVDAADEYKELNRLTLGDIAQRAGVPYAFALEAQQVGLLRADQGRGKRRRRYRERLKNGLRKLHTLRTGGLSWQDITAWSKRRFQPGYEHERVWPVGFASEESNAILKA